MIKNELPSLLAAQSLVAKTAELTRIGGALAAAQSLRATDSAETRLQAAISDMDRLLEKLRTLSEGAPEVARFGDAARHFTNLMTDFASASRRRVTLEIARDTAFAATTAEVGLLYEQSSSLIANASSRVSNALSSVYDVEDDPARIAGVLDTLDIVLDVDLFNLGQMRSLVIKTLTLPAMLDDLLLVDREALDPIAADVEAALVAIGRSIRSIPDEALQAQMRTTFDRIRASIDPAGTDTLIPVVKALGDLTEELKGFDERLLAANMEIEENANQIAAERTESIAAAQASAERSSETVQTVMVLLGLGALLASALIGYFYLHRRILRRLSVITTTTRRLADGESDIEVPKAEADELGQMAAALRVFKANSLEKIRLEAERAEATKRAEEQQRVAREEIACQFEASVLAIVENVSSGAIEMRDSARGTSDRASRAQQRASDVADKSDSASENVGRVAAAAEELSVSIQEIAGQANRSASECKTAVDAAMLVRDNVNDLREASGRIGSIVGLISDIANQTNLLALNATIEAARAGDAGKGFAVVASEVKSLASQSAAASNEIGGQISGVQARITTSVDSIQAIAETIEKLNTVTLSISSSVDQQRAATTEISSNIQLAARGSSDVTDIVRDMAGDISATGDSSAQAVDSSTRLADQSLALRREVTTFLGNMRAA
ncbi:methyl-accepting chemotaxis protein [Acuticoccus sp. MNP-M23]|uniref:methyl-accepting chemotaxis protein n=1 Tax=Acuticoccus sp. MNP-M23 TaxID=3072793 RepID=UPI002814B7C5|nr:methyl-accepting chemotaxis protein [Acuticoccus sp. MNP-M23]WMS42598.1 methyl-accepting chemotaxis protein [Acuticoccus sp. MNP-M23]